MGHRIPQEFGTHRKLYVFVRNTVFIGAGVGIAAFTSLSNSVFLDKVRKWYQLYEKDGTPKKMDPNLAQLCITALQETRIPSKKKLHSKFFYVNGTEVFSAGSYEMRNGVIIGVPFNFTFNSVSDVNKDLIRTPSGQRINWDSVAGQHLLQSMILSEEAKKFAIAKEMYFSNTFRLTLLSLVGTFCALFPVLIDEVYTKGQRKPANLRTVIALYMISIPLAVFKYLLFDEICTSYYSSNADTLAASLNEQYRRGAIEYYRKKLMANKAWRELLGKEGLHLYTESGDEKGWRRRNRITPKLKLLEGETAPNTDEINESTTERMIQ